MTAGGTTETVRKREWSTVLFRRLARPLATVLVAGGVIGALVFGGYIIGRSVESAVIAENADLQSAFVEVERGTVERTLAFSGEVLPLMPVDVVFAGSGTITEVFISSEVWLQPGSRVLDVDELPVFASDPGVFLPYRDLQEGDEGPDVVGLQSFLTDLGLFLGEVDGTFETETRRAVETMYLEATGIKESVFRRSTIILLDRRLQVDMVLVARGQTIEEGSVIAALVAGAPVVYGEVNSSTASQLAVDDLVWLDGVADPVQGTIVGISAPAASADGRVLQSIEVEPVSDDDVEVGEKYRVTRVLESSESDGLIVPVLSVQTDSQGGTFVRVQSPVDALVPGRRVDVQIGVSDGTRVAVTGTGLMPGTMVEVPGGPNA